MFLLLAANADAQQPPAPASPYPYAATAPLGPPQPLMRTTSLQQNRQPSAGVPLPPGNARMLEQGLDLDQPAPYTIQLEPPGIERVGSAVQSDAHLLERIRQENRERRIPERVVFPADPVLSNETYKGRKWDPMRLEVAPYYVCHGRLRFQQINFERYGWDLGILQPFVSAGEFLSDVAFLPYHMAVEPLRCFEYNTGWCLPGDPVPLMLYPLHPSATGFVAEVGTILTLVACFP